MHHAYIQTYEGMIHPNLSSVCERLGWGGVAGIQDSLNRPTTISDPDINTQTHTSAAHPPDDEQPQGLS